MTMTHLLRQIHMVRLFLVSFFKTSSLFICLWMHKNILLWDYCIKKTFLSSSYKLRPQNNRIPFKMKSLLLLLFLTPACLARDKLVIILLDGFRYDYIDRRSEQELPHLKSLLREGARAEYVQTIFPAVSFPSWTTIVTGTVVGDLQKAL